MMKRTSFCGVSSRRSCGLGPVNFIFFGSDRGIDLDYCDIELFALETNIILAVLRLQPSTIFWTLLLTPRATPFHLRDSCPL